MFLSQFNEVGVTQTGEAAQAEHVAYFFDYAVQFQRHDAHDFLPLQIDDGFFKLCRCLQLDVEDVGVDVAVAFLVCPTGEGRQLLQLLLGGVVLITFVDEAFDKGNHKGLVEVRHGAFGEVDAYVGEHTGLVLYGVA